MYTLVIGSTFKSRNLLRGVVACIPLQKEELSILDISSSDISNSANSKCLKV